MINIIVCVGLNNEIGKNNKMLWNNKEELRYFREKTLNHKILMGKNTYLSIGKILDSRINYIVTSKKLNIENAVIINNLEEILKYYENLDEEIFVIGGESIYNQSMKYASKIYLSKINKKFDEADKFFPRINENEFLLEYAEKRATFDIYIYARRK